MDPIERKVVLEILTGEVVCCPGCRTAMECVLFSPKNKKCGPVPFVAFVCPTCDHTGPRMDMVGMLALTMRGTAQEMAELAHYDKITLAEIRR